MSLAVIGTAGIISAYFFRHITSGYSLNVSDPVEVQPVQLSYGLCVFGCGLVFWLLALSWAKLHEVAKLANLITPITTLNLYCCLLKPSVKFPLLVRFLVLFQASSNLALLFIWAFLSLEEYMKSSPTPRVSRVVSRPRKELEKLERESLQEGKQPKLELLQNVEKKKRARPSSIASLFVGGKVDEAKGSGSGHGSGASGREENRGRYGGNDGGGGGGGGGGAGGGGESGSGHGSGASGREKNRGRYGGNDGGGGAGGGGESGSGHGSGASGSGEDRGGSEGGDRGRDWVGADPESGRRVTNTEQAFKISKITEMSLMLTAQMTAAVVGFYQTTPSSSSKAMLDVVLIDLLVAYLCGLTSMWLSSNNPEYSKAAKIFAVIGFVCTALGFILTVAMFVTWYLVLIPVLLFGVVWLIFGVVWLIFFRIGSQPRARY